MYWNFLFLFSKAICPTSYARKTGKPYINYPYALYLHVPKSSRYTVPIYGAYHILAGYLSTLHVSQPRFSVVCITFVSWNTLLSFSPSSCLQQVKRNGSGFSLVESICLPLTFNSVFQTSEKAFPCCNTNIFTKNEQFTTFFLDYPQKYVSPVAIF